MKSLKESVWGKWFRGLLGAYRICGWPQCAEVLVWTTTTTEVRLGPASSSPYSFISAVLLHFIISVHRGRGMRGGQRATLCSQCSPTNGVSLDQTQVVTGVATGFTFGANSPVLSSVSWVFCF